MLIFVNQHAAGSLLMQQLRRGHLPQQRTPAALGCGLMVALLPQKHA
jgi:hypothetical protein